MPALQSRNDQCTLGESNLPPLFRAMYRLGIDTCKRAVNWHEIWENGGEGICGKNTKKGNILSGRRVSTVFQLVGELVRGGIGGDGGAVSRD